MNRPYSSPVGSQKARPFLVIRTCKHIRDNGALCQVAAQRGSAYCRAHLQLHQRSLKMARASRAASRIKLPILEDMQAVRVAQARVQMALQAGHIEESRARLLRWGLRMVATNFRYMEKCRSASRALPVWRRRQVHPVSPIISIRSITIVDSRALRQNDS